MGTTDQTAVGVREATDDEVRFFWDNGWAFLPGLIGRTSRPSSRVARRS